MDVGPQFDGVQPPEPEFFSKEKYPGLSDELRSTMERVKRNMDARQAVAAQEKGELPGMPQPEDSSPVCGDCALPMQATYNKPKIRPGKAPMYSWFCSRHGTIYHPQRPPKRS